MEAIIMIDRYLVSAVIVCMAGILWRLSLDAWFLQTRFGRFIFVNRDFYDVNQTAFAVDSTGPIDLYAQASEVFCKNIVGRVLPNLSCGDVEAKQDKESFVFAKELDDLFPRYMNNVRHPYGTYYDHLKAKLHDTEDPTAALKQCAAMFMENHHENLQPDVFKCFENYVVEIRSQSFTTQFQKFFETRKARQSFHTFGTDMSLLKKAINKNARIWRHFIVTYENAYHNSPVYYTEIKTQTQIEENAPHVVYGKSYSDVEFEEQLINDELDTVFLVQEDYARWAQHGKCKVFGKKASLSDHILRITRGIIFDDIDCWDYQGKPNTSFVQVNSVNTARIPSYFETCVRDKQPAIYTSIGFWTWLLLLSVLWFVVFSLILNIVPIMQKIIASDVILIHEHVRLSKSFRSVFDVAGNLAVTRIGTFIATLGLIVVQKHRIYIPKYLGLALLPLIIVFARKID